MLVFSVPYKSPIPSKLTGLFLHLPLTMNSHILYVLYYLALLLAFGYFMVFHFPNMTALTFPSLDPASINKLVNEIDDNSFHHHPSWPQRWSHPEFAADDFSRTWVHAMVSKYQTSGETVFIPCAAFEISLGLCYL